MEFKVDANGVKMKKVRWAVKTRRGKSKKWKSRWVPVRQGATVKTDAAKVGSGQVQIKTAKKEARS